MCDLDHPILAGAKYTDSWRTRKGDLQRAFPLDVMMVPSSMITVTADGERLTCGGFSLGVTIHLGSIEFIVDYFGGLSHSPRRGDSDVAFMGPTHSGTPSLLRAMIRTPPRGSSQCQVGKGALASTLRGGTTQGLHPLLSQPHHGWRTL
jgi:hypothetical protein